MALIFSYQGLGLALKLLTNQSKPEDLVLHLFINDFYPAAGDSISMFQEAAGAGYTATVLTADKWTTKLVGHMTQATYRKQVYTFKGRLGDVYGFWLSAGMTGLWVCAGRFADGPYRVRNNGDQIGIEPIILDVLGALEQGE